MKVAIFSDFHAGIRKFSSYFMERHKEFIDTFIDDVENKNIDTIFFLGDFVDNRRVVDYSTLNNIIEYFFDKVENSSIKRIICIIGNHDMYYGNSYDNNIYQTLKKHYSKLKVVDKIITSNIGGKECIFVPFLHKNNFKEFDDYMKESYDYCFGHFNILDFYKHYNKKVKKRKSKLKSVDVSISDFSNIEKYVFSGHIHMRAEKSNVIYVGSPLQDNFGMADMKNGYYILDLEKDEHEFIHYDMPLFFKVVINDFEDFKKFEKNREMYYNKFVIFILEKMSEEDNEKVRDRMRLFSDRFESFKIIDKMIVEDIAQDMDFNDDEQLEKIEEFLRDENVMNIFDDFVEINYGTLDEDERLEVRIMFESIYNDCKNERLMKTK